MLLGGLVLYFFFTPIILWRAGRDLDLVKSHQKTFFKVSTLEFPDGTVVYGIGFDSHYGLLLPLSGTIMLLDSDGTKRHLKGGHLYGPNGLRMLMHLYRKMQETKNSPWLLPPSLIFAQAGFQGKGFLTGSGNSVLLFLCGEEGARI